MSTYIPRVGDRVRRLVQRDSYTASSPVLPVGHEVTVASLWSGNDSQRGFIDENGVSHGARFVELVEPSTITTGSRVRRTTGNNAQKAPGDEFIVREVRDYDHFIIDDNGDAHHPHYVELVESPQPAAIPRPFQPGDRVRRTGDTFMDVVHGEVYTFVSYYDTATMHVLHLEGLRDTYDADKFELAQSATGIAAAELVPSTSETFDSYDPRMLPMFKRIADAATEAGHCREFDELAAVAGVPSRAEIIRLTAPPAPTEPGLYVSASLTRDGELHTLTGRLTLYKRISINTDTWWEIRTSAVNSVREVYASDLPSDLVRLVVAA